MMVEPKTYIEWPLTAEHESSQGPFLYAGSCVQQGLFSCLRETSFIGAQKCLCLEQRTHQGTVIFPLFPPERL